MTRWGRISGLAASVALVLGMTGVLGSAHPEIAARSASLEVRIEGGLLSVTVANTPLVDVLHTVGYVAGIDTVIEGDLNTPVTLTLTGVSLADGLRRLADGHLLVLSHSNADSVGGARRVVAMRVYPNPGVGRVDENGTAGGGASTTAIATDAPQSEAAPAVRRVIGNARLADEETESNEVGMRRYLRHLGIHKGFGELDRDAKIAIVERLATEGDTDAAALLGSLVAGDDDPLVRHLAGVRLTHIAGADAVDAFAHALRAEDPSIRGEVVDALGQIADERATQALGQVLFGDPDPRIRLFAIQQLSARGGQAARALVEAAADDPEETVGQEARRALAEWGRP